MRLPERIKAFINGRADPAEKVEERERFAGPLAEEFAGSFTASAIKEQWCRRAVLEINDTFNIALDNWRRQQQSSFALVGFKGQGKTLMVERLVAGQDALLLRCHSKVVSRQDLDRVFHSCSEKAGSLEAYLQGLRKTVALDDCQNLFLRTVGGFEALNSFLSVLSKTWGQVFWVTAWERAAWLYLDAVMDISKFFTSVVYLKPVQGEAMQEMAVSLAGSLGYTMEYSNDYFQQLVKAANGMLAASHHWLLQGAHSLANDKVTLALPDFTVEGLGELNERELYALGGLVQNDPLTAGQLALVINEAEVFCEQVLAKLSRYNLCHRIDQGYSLNPVYLPQVLSLLDKQRFLYIPN